MSSEGEGGMQLRGVTSGVSRDYSDDDVSDDDDVAAVSTNISKS